MQIIFLYISVAGFEFDYIFDWTILKYQQSQKNKTQPHGLVSALSMQFLSSYNTLLIFLIKTIHLLQPGHGESSSGAIRKDMEKHQG